MEQQLLFYERNNEEIEVNITSRTHKGRKGDICVQVHRYTYVCLPLTTANKT